MKKLNLGCGKDIREGYVNLDIAKLKGVDIVWDVNKLPLPFKEGEFDEILCNDVLEHVDYIPLLKDLHRILKKGGILKIRVPHFTSANNFVDPTHKKMFSINTFDFFIKNHERNYYFDFWFERIVGRKIIFDKRLIFLNSLFNGNSFNQRFYERTFFRSLFPAVNIELDIKK